MNWYSAPVWPGRGLAEVTRVSLPEQAEGVGVLRVDLSAFSQEQAQVLMPHLPRTQSCEAAWFQAYGCEPPWELEAWTQPSDEEAVIALLRAVVRADVPTMPSAAPDPDGQVGMEERSITPAGCNDKQGYSTCSLPLFAAVGSGGTQKRCMGNGKLEWNNSHTNNQDEHGHQWHS